MPFSPLHAIFKTLPKLKEVSTSMATEAQMLANQANAQKSLGPVTEAGKAKSSLNAVKTGLTGRTVLLPGDDAARYEAHVADFFNEFAPVGDAEQKLVQSVADSEWRLLRIPALEMAVYALGRLELADLFPNEDPEVRQQLIQAKVFLVYQRQFNNLSIQETRLRRQRERDLAALKQLQDERKRQESTRLTRAAQLYMKAISENRAAEWKPEESGFEFSIAKIQARAQALNPDLPPNGVGKPFRVA
jgi:hypothetical protein